MMWANRYLVVSLVVGSFVTGLSAPATGADDLAKPSKINREVLNLIERDLPDGWAADLVEGKFVLRKLDEPIIVNVISSNGRRNGEDENTYLLRHRVPSKYRFTIRLGPKISADRVTVMNQENDQTRGEMKKIRQSSFFRKSKGTPGKNAAKTDEERKLWKRYHALDSSLHEIPAAHFRDRSIYTHTTNFGYARFMSDDVAEECRGVEDQIISAFDQHEQLQRPPNKE